MTIYAGTAHTVADIPESFYEELKFLLQDRPDAFALLEFTSRGNDHRQIDCAIVSAGGVDLIEIKHKRNPVKGTADGPWATDDDGQLNVFSNRKSGVTENPYQQASNSANDLAWGLARVLRLRRERIRVYPMVLIPEAHPDCEIAEHSNVKLALGSDELKGKLRAFNWNAVWSRHEYGELPTQMGLTPIELGNVTGRVVDGETGQPVRGVQINVPGREEPLYSDFRGGFRFMSPLGAHLELVLEPETSHEVTQLKLHVSHRHLELGNVALPPVVTEAARQAALAQLEEEFKQRLLSLQAMSHEQVEHLTAMNQTLIDGLQREHDERRALERRLAAAVKQDAPDNLTHQVQQRHELARVREQLEYSEQLLQELRRSEIQIGDAISREAAQHLVLLRAARMPALPPAGSPVSPPGDAARFRVTGRSPVNPVSEPRSEATATPPADAPAQEAGQGRWPRQVWPVALGVTALLALGVGLWQGRGPESASSPTMAAPLPEQPTSPALRDEVATEASSPPEPEAAMAEPTERLPGEPVDPSEVPSSAPSWSDGTLPGEPVDSQ